MFLSLGFSFQLALCEHVSSGRDVIISLRGGIVPQASEVGGDYYEQFKLDYGRSDRVRNAGALRGFIPGGNVANLPESDPFLKWLNEHLERGPQPISGRLKPFYVIILLSMLSS